MDRTTKGNKDPFHAPPNRDQAARKFDKKQRDVLTSILKQKPDEFLMVEGE